MVVGGSETEGEPRLRVVFAAAEYAPLLQSGGLGDAVAGLAGALADRGHELHCLLPGLGPLWTDPRCRALEPATEEITGLSDEEASGRWWTTSMGKVQLHVFDLPSFRNRKQLYGGADEGLRFISFARAVAARATELMPDVLVAHDWHAALAVCLLRTVQDVGPPRRIGTVQVIHNNAHLGLYGARELAATGLPMELFNAEGIEFHGSLALLKAGIGWADRIVTVSPRYAEEIQTPLLGDGLDGLYRYRSDRLVGITNGIDTERYDPSADPALAAPFSARRPQGREACRSALLAELALDGPADGLLLGVVGRLALQKGWDVLVEAIPSLVERGAALALVGEGDPALADQIATAARRFPGRVALHRGWNDELARRVYAGADAVLVPSRFEPCGLVQLLAQRYGALPVAHAVGGLRDTIVDGRSGILFEPLSVATLVEAVDRAAALLATRGKSAVSQDLMKIDVSWSEPARRWEWVLHQVADDAAARL